MNVRKLTCLNSPSSCPEKLTLLFFGEVDSSSSAPLETSASNSFLGIGGLTALGLSAAKLIFAPSPASPTLRRRTPPLLGVMTDDDPPAPAFVTGVEGFSALAFNAAIRSAIVSFCGGVWSFTQSWSSVLDADVADGIEVAEELGLRNSGALAGSTDVEAARKAAIRSLTERATPEFPSSGTEDTLDRGGGGGGDHRTDRGLLTGDGLFFRGPRKDAHPHALLVALVAVTERRICHVIIFSEIVEDQGE